MPARPRGFIALIASIVISTILLSLAAATGQGTFFTRFEELNAEYKRIAQGYAEACVQVALLKLMDDYDYSVPSDAAYDSARGGVVVPFGTTYGVEADCVIEGPTSTPAETDHARAFRILTHGRFQGAFSTLLVIARIQNPHYASDTALPRIAFDSWQEIP